MHRLLLQRGRRPQSCSAASATRRRHTLRILGVLRDAKVATLRGTVGSGSRLEGSVPDARDLGLGHRAGGRVRTMHGKVVLCYGSLPQRRAQRR